MIIRRLLKQCPSERRRTFSTHSWRAFSFSVLNVASGLPSGFHKLFPLRYVGIYAIVVCLVQIWTFVCRSVIYRMLTGSEKKRWPLSCKRFMELPLSFYSKENTDGSLSVMYSAYDSDSYPQNVWPLSTLEKTSKGCSELLRCLVVAASKSR